MCDYSLHSIKSRPAKVGDKLTTSYFGTGTRGFAASEDPNVVVCVRPGTELSFAREVTCQPIGIFGWRDKMIRHKTAIFRQINKEKVVAHHDALEFPDGHIVLLTSLKRRIAQIREAHRIRREAPCLLAVDDYLLADIGLRRSDLAHINRLGLRYSEGWGPRGDR